MAKNSKGKKQPVKSTRKRKYHEARAAGFSSKEASRAASWSDERLKKEIQRIERNAHRRENYKKAREAGLSSKEASRKRSASARKVTLSGNRYLVVAYRDKTDSGDSEALFEVKDDYSHVPDSYLIQEILGFLEFSGGIGYLGEYQMDTTDNYKSLMNFYDYQDYLIAYRGEGKDRHALIVLIASMMKLTYTVMERDIFIQDLINNLNTLNNQAARDNAAWIQANILEK